ncbi:hypothetical protein ACIPX0_17415 [Streptomyces sp. NPDC090075]|uniref:hypothetical protein n=1 Tax=Streptomyces sp. NPDC090075 TaxID=3365937 RepID=UPI003813FA89
MPGYLLHDDAIVTCAHAGDAKPTRTDARVKVNGFPVAVAAPYTVDRCTLSEDPDAVPCLSAEWTGATRVQAGRLPVLLSRSQSACVPTGTPLTVAVVQIRVQGV